MRALKPYKTRMLGTIVDKIGDMCTKRTSLKAFRAILSLNVTYETLFT